MESTRPRYSRFSDIMPNKSQAAQSPVAIVDTNILMAIPQIDRFNWGVKAVQIYILYSVMDELCGLSRDKYDLEKAHDAQVAYEYLDALLKRTGPKGLPIRGDGSRLFFVAPLGEALEPLDTENVDHQQIAFAQSMLDANPQRFCAVITRDREMAELANLASTDVQVIVPGSFALEESLRLQFARRYDYWAEWQPEPETVVEQPEHDSRSRKQTAPLQRRPDPENRLQRTVRGFYSQIKSARHRAILSIAPLNARLALTAHLILLNARYKRRVVLVYVENVSAAEYWAAELRVRAHLPVEAVQVYGEEKAIDSFPRAVVCLHEQVENRFRGCAAGLREEGRQITLVVDGADLLAPENLAMLLFEDVQFVGFTRYKMIQNGNPAKAGLGEFFDQQSLLHYTFADAERDGWLRSFDLVRHPVIWQPEEAREYGHLNARFVRAYNAILKAFPALAQRDDFAVALREIRSAVSDPRLDNYLVLKARREEMAQIAHGKLDALMNLLASEGAQDGRSLVFDPSSLWVPVLHNLLERRKVRVATGRATTTREEWDLLWHRFEAGRLDVLLMTAVPPFGLIRANPSRLIITTPIAPFSQLVDAVDWALSHSHPHGRSPLKVHLPYLPGTPEEPALQALVDAVRGHKRKA